MISDAAPKALLFDFFGTLVGTSPAPQDFRQSYRVLQSFGASISYQEFLTTWSKVTQQFNKLSEIDHREYGMTDIGKVFLNEVLKRDSVTAEVDLLIETYLLEWDRGVYHLPGLDALVDSLAIRHKLAIVSNTQDPYLIASHLETMGISHLFDAVITSLQVGWRKPHTEIYATALRTLKIDASEAVFVGDSYLADYHGPTQFGIRSFLIDPQHREKGVPDTARLSSIFALPHRILAYG
ncbi:HAD family hydrolase [Nonomuraea sp. KM88]|uniref:HAD family hydrolase n=1 Tax=Nonomuraea sp. KM88 TaxID=3457427 RepID=UPI003FCD146C